MQVLFDKFQHIVFLICNHALFHLHFLGPNKKIAFTQVIDYTKDGRASADKDGVGTRLVLSSPDDPNLPVPRSPKDCVKVNTTEGASEFECHLPPMKRVEKENKVLVEIEVESLLKNTGMFFSHLLYQIKVIPPIDPFLSMGKKINHNAISR